MDRALLKMDHLIEIHRDKGGSKADDMIRAKAQDARVVLELSFLHNQVSPRQTVSSDRIR